MDILIEKLTKYFDNYEYNFFKELEENKKVQSIIKKNKINLSKIDIETKTKLDEMVIIFCDFNKDNYSLKIGKTPKYYIKTVINLTKQQQENLSKEFSEILNNDKSKNSLEINIVEGGKISDEELNLIKTLLNKNSRDWLENTQFFDRFYNKNGNKMRNECVEKFNKFHEWYNNKMNSLERMRGLLVSSIILYAYGIRACNDIDFYYHYKPEITPELTKKILSLNKIVDIGVKGYGEWIEKSSKSNYRNRWFLKEWPELCGSKIGMDEIILNPEYYWYYKGIKTMKIECDIKRRERRFRPKAIADLFGINKLYAGKFPVELGKFPEKVWVMHSQIEIKKMNEYNAYINRILKYIKKMEIEGTKEELFKLFPTLHSKETELKGYYTGVEGEESHILGMTRFHNFVKEFLYKRNLKPGFNLLELAAGRGGDLRKIIYKQPTNVIFVDIDSQGLAQIRDKIKNIEENKKHLKLPKIEYIVGDIGENLTKEIGQNLNKTKPKSINLVSMQFAIHYFLGTKERIDNLFKNVDTFLISGGHFIFTCLGGKKVYDLLKKNEVFEQFDENKNRLFKIVRKYESHQPFAYFGQAISVEVETIGSHDEFLVNLDYILSYFKNRGYDLINIGNFEKLYSDYLKIKDKIEMSPQEKIYSFLNYYVVLKKK